MEDDYTPSATHPMGELSNLESNAQNSKESIEKIQCDTFAGLVHVEWDEQTPITPVGQLVFFAQFLNTCQLFAPWVNDCPLYYSSPNSPSKEFDLLLFAIKCL